MVISRTPYRISFFGGGTDFPEWYLKNGGEVLASTIDKYIYISCRYLPPFFEHRFRVSYSKIEECKSVEQIEHPAVREILKFLSIKGDLEIHYDGDLPKRSGMGSSSSFSVGLLNALYAYKGMFVSKQQLATESIHLEQKIIKEIVGSQDQVSAAYGGFNHIKFLQNGEIEVHPMTISQDRFAELNSNFMLLYTSIMRTSDDVTKTYVNAIQEKEKQLSLMSQMVEEAKSILFSNRPIAEFGSLIHEAWQVKRSLSDLVSNSEIDCMYEQARKAGAIGGKLTGAGGGGFLLLFVPPERHANVKENLKQFIQVPIKMENHGSQIIFYNMQQRYDNVEKARTINQIVPFSELNLSFQK